MGKGIVIARHLAGQGVAGWLAFGAALAGRSAKIAEAARPGDDEGLRSAKERLGLAAAYLRELTPRVGREEALRVVRALLEDISIAEQRRAYGHAATWDAFHDAHFRAMRSGFVAVNEHDVPEVSPDRVSFHVVRCRFHEALGALGAPELTEALCRSDERVFPDLVPGMQFDRGDEKPDTIARGASRCGFVFHRSAGDRA